MTSSRRVRRGLRACVAACIALVVPAIVGVASASAVWVPRPGTTWQWDIIENVPEPFLPVQMYDVDLEQAVPSETRIPVTLGGRTTVVTWRAGQNAGIVDRLHRAGKIAICYLDTGAYETYRPDAALFPGTPGWRRGDPSSDVILNDTGWNDEYWLDIRPGQWQKFAPIMWARLDLAKRIGCDGVEPDQNNPWRNVPDDFPLTLAHQKAWYLKVAEQAHLRDLSVGMKNAPEEEVTDADTVRAFDWNLNEECFVYEECDTLEQFIDAGKAVFNTEFTDVWVAERRTSRYADPLVLRRTVCALAARRDRYGRLTYLSRFSILIKTEVPDDPYYTC
ncbi:endo alpha-1,4 polygalactosaminidase [Conexibacter woesei]|uniref:endo alpha-1,4 polygalactosaminidase n=1 Tax=Conexibacter woesei TaxID=191495 RepID=UPI00135F1903|nr:endo alpha-1,4 polygalactosaminidase [Conexibacter woesei]